jgi:hypothetical protein
MEAVEADGRGRVMATLDMYERLMEDILEENSAFMSTDHGVQRKNLVMVLRLRTQALDEGARGPSLNDMRGVLRVFKDVMKGNRDVPMEYMAYDLTDAEEYAEGFTKGISIMAIGDHGACVGHSKGSGDHFIAATARSGPKQPH